MGVLFGFVFGWFLGARAGPERLQEVVDAARTVKQSPLLEAGLDISRRHLASGLRRALDLFSSGTLREPEDLVERVRRLAASRSG